MNIVEGYFHFNRFLISKRRRKTRVSQSFLEWFVGFFEGDGSLIQTTRVAIWNYTKLMWLHHIRDTLGFGAVYSQGNTTSRSIVQHMKGLHKILSILNGNIVLPKRQAQFHAFLAAYNQKALEIE